MDRHVQSSEQADEHDRSIMRLLDGLQDMVNEFRGPGLMEGYVPYQDTSSILRSDGFMAHQVKSFVPYYLQLLNIRLKGFGKRVFLKP
jgi:hypothetical protein